VLRPPIEMRFEVKLQLSSKKFQRRITCHLHARKSGRFLTFCGQESNCLFFIPDLSFCHNLCCKCLNGSCEPIWNIYISISFRWYKKLLNGKCFDLCNRSLKVWESTGAMGAHLGMWVFMFTLSHTPLSLRPYKPLL